MGNLEKRLALLEEFKNPPRTRVMTDTELALRMYWAVNGLAPVNDRFVEVLREVATEGQADWLLATVDGG